MKNFEMMGAFDHEPLLKEIEQSTLWNWLNIRRLSPMSEHRAVEDIVLRFAPVQGGHGARVFYDGISSVDYFTQSYFPQTMITITHWLRGMIGEPKLGRIVIAKLKAYGEIKAHEDQGEYAKNHDRFHFVIKTNPNVTFFCGAEAVHMGAGEIWKFDNKKEHSVYNAGDTDRIHLVVDLFTDQLLDL